MEGTNETSLKNSNNNNNNNSNILGAKANQKIVIVFIIW